MSDETRSNTADNTAPKATGKPFVRGDPRINRLGRPKSFDALRELAQQIAHEKARDKHTGSVITFDGRAASIAEMILRQWAQSVKPELQRAFIEVAFGKVPDAVRITFESMTDEQKREYVRDLLAAGGYILAEPESERLPDKTESGTGEQ